MPVPHIQVEHLTKTFYITKKEPGVRGAIKALFRPNLEAKVAVDDITFVVEPGEVVGYIGVNGAGKSTTTKMPTSARATVLGLWHYSGTGS